MPYWVARARTAAVARCRERSSQRESCNDIGLLIVNFYIPSVEDILSVERGSDER